APDGSASLITQGWLRASFRYVDPKRSPPGNPYLPDDRATPVNIGQTTEYRMDIWDIAHTLAPGHRLRLWLSSSDAPTHEPLPVAGRNLILHDADHPSELLLGTRLPAPPCGAGGPCVSAAGLFAQPGRAPRVACQARTGFLAAIPSGLRHVRATAHGRRLRLRRRGGRLVAAVRPRARDRSVTVRIVGTDRRGRRV